MHDRQFLLLAQPYTEGRLDSFEGGAVLYRFTCKAQRHPQKNRAAKLRESGAQEGDGDRHPTLC